MNPNTDQIGQIEETKDLEGHQEATAIGEELKQMRLNADVSLPQLADKTKINIDILKKIESGQFDQLPGKAFVRGFIKNICLELSQPPDSCLSKFDKIYSLETLKKLTSSTSSSHIKQSPVRKWKKHFIAMAICSLLLVAGYFQFYFDRSALPSNQQIIEENKPPMAEVEQPEIETINAEAPLSTEPITSEMAINPTAEADVPASAVAFSELAINALKPVKVKLKCDENARLTKELPIGTELIRFNDNCELLIYDSSAVELSFNGFSLGKLADTSTIRRLRFVHEENKIQ